MKGIGRMPALKRATESVAWPCAAAGAASRVHLLALLVAAMRGRRTPVPAAEDGLRLAVVVPAQNEEAQIARTLRSIQASRHPGDQPSHMVVVADNCTDRTTAVARERGQGLGAIRPDGARDMPSIGRSFACSTTPGCRPWA